MKIERVGEKTKCGECGHNGRQERTWWKMCDKCLTAYCGLCFMHKMGSPSHCDCGTTGRKWLKATGCAGTMKFE